MSSRPSRKKKSPETTITPFTIGSSGRSSASCTRRPTPQKDVRPGRSLRHPDLATQRRTTQVVGMQSLGKKELVGFVELQVGSLAVQVPIRHAKPEDQGIAPLPLASFETEGEHYAILIRGDGNSRAVERA